MCFLIILITFLGMNLFATPPNSSKTPQSHNPGLLNFENETAKKISIKVNELLRENKPKEATRLIFEALKDNSKNAELHLKAALLMLDLKLINECYQLLENASYVAKKDSIKNKVNFYIFTITKEFKTYDLGIPLLQRIDNSQSSEQTKKYIKELKKIKKDKKK